MCTVIQTLKYHVPHFTLFLYYCYISFFSICRLIIIFINKLKSDSFTSTAPPPQSFLQKPRIDKLNSGSRSRLWCFGGVSCDLQLHGLIQLNHYGGQKGVAAQESSARWADWCLNRPEDVNSEQKRTNLLQFLEFLVFVLILSL